MLNFINFIKSFFYNDNYIKNTLYLNEINKINNIIKNYDSSFVLKKSRYGKNIKKKRCFIDIRIKFFLKKQKKKTQSQIQIEMLLNNYLKINLRKVICTDIKSKLFGSSKLYKNNFSKFSVKKIKNGFNHKLILCENNELYSSGNNEYGQCGINSVNNENKIIGFPKRVDFFKNLPNIKNIYCGNYVSFVLLENNDLYAFGNDCSIIHRDSKTIQNSYSVSYSVHCGIDYRNVDHHDKNNYFVPYKMNNIFESKQNEIINKIITSKYFKTFCILTKLNYNDSKN